MKQFLEEYGKAIFVLVLMAILIAFVSPLGVMIKEYTTNKVNDVDTIASDTQYEITTGKKRRPKPPETATDNVYCILYDDGEMTISQNETTPDSGRTVVKKGFYSMPSNCSKTMTTVRFTEAVKPKSCYLWFNNCQQLTNIENLNYLYTNEVTNMRSMFSNCSKITTLDVSNFNTSNVTDMQYMFYNCNNLTTLDVSNFDTSKITNMCSMFSNCSKITTLDVSNFNTSNITTMSYMFSTCTQLTSLDVSNFNTSNVTDMYSMFSNCSNLTSLDLSNFDTSKITTMRYMFNTCTKLTTLDLSNFDTSNVTDMSGMFYNCINLITLDVSNFDTSSVIDMSYMFYSCSKLTSLDLSNFDTSKVTDMYSMFSGINMKTLDINNFDLSNTTNVSYMFKNIQQLDTLILGDLKFSDKTSVDKMFYTSLNKDNVSRIKNVYSSQKVKDKFCTKDSYGLPDTNYQNRGVKTWIVQE